MSKSALRGLVGLMTVALVSLGLAATPSYADDLIATKVTATPPTVINEGKTFDVTGLVTYNPSADGLTFVPLEGAHVDLTFGGGNTYYATTNSSGAYTVVGMGFASTFAIDNVFIRLDLDTTPNGSTLAASQSDPFDLPVARQITTLGINTVFDSDLHLDINAQLNGSASGGLAGKVVTLQYASDGHTWHTVAPTHPWLTDVNGHYLFSGYDTSPDDYLRFKFAGDSGFQASTSNVAHIHRTATRIIHFGASPEPVTKGHKVTVKGTAEKRSGTKWVTLDNKVIQYFIRYKGHTVYHYKGYSRSSAHGHFSKKFTATKDGSWSAVWFTEDSTPYENAVSAEDYVNVR